MLVKASDVFIYWYEYQLRSKYTVLAQNGVLLAFGILKGFLILKQAVLMAFVWTMAAEAIAMAIALLLMFGRWGHPLGFLSFSWERALELLRHSWPLAISSMAILVYMKLDQIMLGEMAGDIAVGIFSAATKVSECWYFIPMAIVSSAFPTILRAKSGTREKYAQHIQGLLDLLVFASLCIAVPVSFMAPSLVGLLFGEAFSGAAAVLSIHVWASIFICLGLVGSQYYIAENRQILSAQATVAGMLTNIVLNLLLIPASGPKGAAIATVCSVAVSGFFFDLFRTELRPLFFMKLRALNPFGVAHRFLARNVLA
jgi:PST family polysaccharide transporter